MNMEIVYQDQDLVVCIKPVRVLSTDEPGGLPELLRQELETQDIRTVHRLDRVVSGLMVLEDGKKVDDQYLADMHYLVEEYVRINNLILQSDYYAD